MSASKVWASAVVAVAAIAGATVAVCLHVIDAGTFGAIVGGAAGAGLGVGAHAAGVSQGQS